MATLRVVTVKSSGGDYSSLNAAYVGEGTDLVAANRLLRIDCYPFVDTADIPSSSFSSDATRYLTIRAVADHGGAWNTSAYTRRSGAFAFGFAVTPQYTVVEGMQVEVTSGTGQTCVQIQTANCTLIRVLCRSWSGDTSGIGINVGANNATVVNCVVDGSDTAFYCGDFANLLLLNCTANGGSRGVWASGANRLTAINVLVKGASIACFDDPFHTGAFTSACSNNVSSDGTAPGTSSRTAQTITFRGTGDFHLAANDTSAIGHGRSLRDFASYPFIEDVDNAERHGTWDVGADQYVAPTTWTLNDLAPLPVAETFASPATEFSQRADFAPLGVLLEAAASGTTFTDSVAESRTATDSQTGLATFVGARAESGTAAETNAAAAVFVGTRAESGTAAETETGLATFVGTAAESVTATDTQAGALVAVGADAESLTATESASGAAAFVGTLPESLAGSDSAASSATFSVSQAESLTATDAATGDLAGAPVVYDVTVDEVLSISDESDATVPSPALDFGGFNDFASPRRRTHAVTQRDRLTVRDRQHSTTVHGVARLDDTLAIVDATTAGADVVAGAADALRVTDQQAIDAAFVGAVYDDAVAVDDQWSDAELHGEPAELLSVDDLTDAAVEYVGATADRLGAHDTAWCTVTRAFIPPAPWTPDTTADDEAAFVAFLMLT